MSCLERKLSEGVDGEVLFEGEGNLLQVSQVAGRHIVKILRGLEDPMWGQIAGFVADGVGMGD